MASLSIRLGRFDARNAIPSPAAITGSRLIDATRRGAKALDCIFQLKEEGRWPPGVLRAFIDLMEHLFGRGALSDE